MAGVSDMVKHLIVHGDARDMKEVADDSVHLIVTSPPYWQLKDYDSPNQIGFNDVYEGYINNLNLVWNECFRALENGCRLCVNIGDQYARSVYYGRYKVIPIRTEVIKFCEATGFDYMGAIIWQKVATTNTTGGATIMGSFPYPRNGILKLDYEFILIFKKRGKPARNPSREIKEQSKLTKEEWNTYFTGHWNFSGVKQDRHLAMFPLELPRRLIKMFTFVGDTVLDPFLGSGTTSLAANQLRRNSIGYEIGSDFIPLIKKKLGVDNHTLFSPAECRFVQQEDGQERDFSGEIGKLPYVFRDFVKLDMKVDPKQLQFGSKIDKDSKERVKFHSVKQIISPELLMLDNGLRIRLIGVRSDKEKAQEALGFLKEKLKGQRVFMKYDDVKHDEDGNLYCYLYLKNKTFINMHLIKNGLAFADASIPYRYRDRFLSMMKG